MGEVEGGRAGNCSKGKTTPASGLQGDGVCCEWGWMEALSVPCVQSVDTSGSDDVACIVSSRKRIYIKGMYSLDIKREGGREWGGRGEGRKEGSV
jgi:hypothetical protein